MGNAAGYSRARRHGKRRSNDKEEGVSAGPRRRPPGQVQAQQTLHKRAAKDGRERSARRAHVAERSALALQLTKLF